MKKLFYRLLLTMVVVACVMPFVLRDRYGQPLMTVSSLKMPDLKIPGKDLIGGLVNVNGDNNPPADKEGIVTVYRWQDDQGIWHFSDKVNPDGRSEVMDVRLNANVTQAPANQATDTAGTPQSEAGGDTLLQPGVIPLLNAGETLKQARNVEGLLQQRYQRQEQTLAH